MNPLEVTFDGSPWEPFFRDLPRGGTLGAERFLALLEQNAQNDPEEAFSLLEERDILLDVSALPPPPEQGETGTRLRLEQQLPYPEGVFQGLETQDPLRLYLEELAGTPAAGDVERLGLDHLAGDPQAAGRLAGLLLGRVVELAFSYRGKGVLLMDLIQEGNLGLWQGILDYGGGDLRALFDRQIRRAMAALIVRQAQANGVASMLRQAMEDYRSVDQRLLTELGRNPTIEEIAQGLHMTPEQARTIAEALRNTNRMGQVHKEPEPAEEDPEEAQTVEDTAYFQMRQRIGELLSSLDELDAKILTLRFGLDQALPLSPEETGKKLGLTPGEVSNRELAALALLRRQ